MLKDKDNINIAICGAAEINHCGPSVIQKAMDLGRALAEEKVILSTGATTGFPLYALEGFKEVGGVSFGLSPAANKREHTDVYRLPTEGLDHIVYTGFGYAGRDLMLVRSVDAVIIGCGRIGSIHEFTISFESEIPIGILEGEWATSEVIKNIIDNSGRKNCSIVFDSDPKRLVQKIIADIKDPSVCNGIAL